MGTFYRTAEYPRARKQHTCTACFGPIPKGEKYVTQSGVYEDRAYRNRYHNECWNILISEGEFDFEPGTLDVPERIAALAEA